MKKVQGKCDFAISILQIFFFKDFIYLFERDRDSQRERGHKQGEWQAEGEAGSPRSLRRDSIPGPQDYDLS